MSLVGTSIGRIRILETLGQGGMGSVYVGFDETLQRKVAVKAIRHDRTLDEETKARFLREARILSQLDHPSICRIHEIVERPEGDYLILELIEGESLKEAMKGEMEHEFKLYVAERVTEALIAAHGQGIAHRDLKPENIMLADDGSVKVLDFGLAYNVDEKLSSMLALGIEVDTSLGERPQGFGAMSQTAAPGAQTVNLADVEAADDTDPTETAVTVHGKQQSWPTMPSTPRDQTLPTVRRVPGGRVPGGSGDEARGYEATVKMSEEEMLQGESGGSPIMTEIGTVMGTVTYMSPEQAQGEVVTVAGDVYSLGLLMQELFTGRPLYDMSLNIPALLLAASRGQTLPMQGIDPDLEILIHRLKSYLPEARPTAQDVLERLRWIRAKPQRRMLHVAGLVLALLFFLGIVKYTMDLRHQRAQAEEARREAEQVSEFLLGLFEVSDPQRSLGETITARELLDDGAQRIRHELADQPISQARMMLTMGRVYRQLGLYSQALPLLEDALTLSRRELGDDHLEVATCHESLANLYHDLGEYGQAEPLFLRALEIRQRNLGEDHLYVAASLNNLAIFYRTQGNDLRAEPLLLRALEIHRNALQEEHPDVARSFNNLGDLYRSMGDLPKAGTYLRQAIAVQEKILDPDHPNLAESRNNLALLHHEQGEASLAEPLYLQTLATADKVLGEDHPNQATLLNNLAELYRATGKTSEAEPLYRKALDIQQRALGEGHPSLTITLGYLAEWHLDRGQVQTSSDLYEQIVAQQLESLGPEHVELAVTLRKQADVLARLGEDQRAEQLLRQALEIYAPMTLNGSGGHSSSGGRIPLRQAIVQTALADLYVTQERWQEAALLYDQADQVVGRQLQEQPKSRSMVVRRVAILIGRGEVHAALGEDDLATANWIQAADLMAPILDVSEFVIDRHWMALALLHQGDTEAARPWVEDLLSHGWQDPRLRKWIE